MDATGMNGDVYHPELQRLTEEQDSNNFKTDSPKKSSFSSQGRDKRASVTPSTKSTSKTKCKDFDTVLEMVGSEGRFQKILLYGVLCPITCISPFLVMNTIFMLSVPDHWCHVPGYNESSGSLDDWKNLTLPREKGPDGNSRYSQCLMYDTLSLDSANASERQPIKCQFGWDYDHTDYSSTIPSEFNWVCDDAEQATNAFTFSAIGNAVGTVIFGIAADKFGRKPIFFLTCFVNIFFRLINLFVPQFLTVYLAVTLLAGTAFPILFSAPCMISAEVSSKEYRAWVYACLWMVWVIGNSAIPLLAYLCRGWFLFGILTSIPGFFLFLYYKIIPESPRWLVTVERTKEACKILLRIAKMNGKKVDPVHLNSMLECLVEDQKASATGGKLGLGVWTLFSKARLAKNTILLCLSWSANMLIYYGLTLNTTNMSGNQFLNYFLLSIIELPSGWLGGVLVEKAGRRWTQAGFFLICTLACVLASATVASPDLSLVVIIAALAAKFCVTVTSLVVYLQGTEIFPTQLRSTGSGFASTFSSCMGIMGPYIIFIGKFHVAGPYMVLCAISAIGMLSSSCLPETLKQSLPETIEDANKFGKGVPFWSWKPKAKENNESKK